MSSTKVHSTITYGLLREPTSPALSVFVQIMNSAKQTDSSWQCKNLFTLESVHKRRASIWKWCDATLLSAHCALRPIYAVLKCCILTRLRYVVLCSSGTSWAAPPNAASYTAEPGPRSSSPASSPSRGRSLLLLAGKEGRLALPHHSWSASVTREPLLSTLKWGKAPTGTDTVRWVAGLMRSHNWP